MSNKNLSGPIPYAVFENFVMRGGPKKFAETLKYKSSLSNESKGGRDYHADIKTEIRRLHSEKKPIEGLRTFLNSLSDEKKKENWRPSVNGYLKLFKSHSVTDVSEATRLNWDCEGLRVHIRPDMRCKLDGHDTFIRLYLKKAPLAKDRAQILLQLMFEAVKSESITNTARVAVIDCKKASVYVRDASNDLNKLQLSIEASYWIKAFNAV